MLAAFGRTTQKALAEFGSPGSWSGVPGGYADSDVLLRQQISESGNYFHLVSNFFEWVFIDYLASGLILGWLCYALGRFLIGAWVGRHGWITRAADFLPGWRQLLRIALPAGLVLEGFATMLAKSSWLPEWEHRDFLADASAPAGRARAVRRLSGGHRGCVPGRPRPPIAGAVCSGGAHGTD